MNLLQRKRVKTRTRLQYEAAECGAASLATILSYFGRVVELSELRLACGVNRDGSNAKQLLKAARSYGLSAKGYRCEANTLKDKGSFPCIVFWGFNHFLVVEGFDDQYAYLSDPAQGRVRVEMKEFQSNFTGVVLELEPGSDFQRGGHERSPLLTLPATLLPYRVALGQLILIGSGQAMFTLLLAGFTSAFIDTFLQNQRLYFGIPIIWLLLISTLGWLALLSIQFLLLRRIELLLSKRLTADLFRKMFQVTFQFYQARLPGEIAGRLLLGMELTQVLISVMLRFLLSLWISLQILIVSMFVSTWLSLLVVVVIVGNLVINWWLTDLRYDANRKLAIETGKANGKGLQGINNIETIKASGLEIDFLTQWHGSFGNVVMQNQTLGWQMALATITANGSTFLLNALLISTGGLLIITGKLSLGTLVAFQFLQGQLTTAISTLPQMNSTVQRLIGNLGRLEDLKASDDDPLVRSFVMPKATSPSSVLSNPSASTRLRGTIKLEQLSYSFDPTSPPFINKLNLTIPAGSQLAIVGGSGSGKTTLIRLIAGLTLPSEGKLLFDDKPWEDHGDQMMRQSLAYVPQQVFVFNASIHDNITLWKPGYSLQELTNAARDAQILETITSHPAAFFRHLRDNGSDLSGGERQRLELCRALLRQPSILLLDEATSALDNATQKNVLNVLKARGMTLVSIAHRLDAALDSDQVLVMEGGQVVERGSPSELLSKQGAFQALVQSEQRDKQKVDV